MALAHKLWLLLMLPIALALGLYGWVGHQNRNAVLMAEASAELRNYGDLVEAGTATVRSSSNHQRIRDRIEGLVQAERLYGIAMMNESGEIEVITSSISDAASRDAITAFAKRASGSGEASEGRMALGQTPVLVRAIRFESGWPSRAVVVRDLSYVAKLTGELTRGLVVTAIGLLFATAIIIGFATRTTVGRPAGSIVAGATRVAAGDLDARVPEAGSRELAHLARAFNEMTKSLREAKLEAERQEAARLAVERKLQHIQALAAVGQVAASVGHEIGSPLNVILGRALRAAAQPGCDPSARKEFETIANQCDRISRYVTRLLAASKPPRETTGSCDAALVARDTLAFLAPELKGRGVEAQLELVGGGSERGGPKVALPADALFQVMFNLLLNAAQAQETIAPGEKRGRAAAGSRAVLRVITTPTSSAAARPRVVVEVEDWGPGVPSDLATSVFEPFVTTKQAHGGSGLGLAIVRGIARDAGGSVEVASAPHGGALFRVSLPAPQPAPSTTCATGSRAEASGDDKASREEAA